MSADYCGVAPIVRRTASASAAGGRDDYKVWVQQKGGNRFAFEIGVTLSIQRPMLTNLHLIYRDNKVAPGDTLMIYKSASSRQLTFKIVRGQGGALPAGATASHHTAAGSKSAHSASPDMCSS